MRHISDISLVKLCLTGETGCYEELVERYQVMVRTLALKLLNDPVESDEVAHRVFIVAFERLGEYPGKDCSFAEWLFRLSFDEASRYMSSATQSAELLEKLGLRRTAARPGQSRHDAAKLP